MRPTLLALALVLSLTGCGHVASPLGASVAPAVRNASGIAAASHALDDFLKSDHTFQAAGTDNAFKVAAEQTDAHTFAVQMWYRDLTGFFGEATSIEAVYVANAHGSHAVERFTLTRLRHGFYQMDASATAHFGHPASVAFHVFDKWDSNMGQNYPIHFQAFPPVVHPW